jgi:hypothetical protein
LNISLFSDIFNLNLIRKGDRKMMKLYKSLDYPKHWIACVAGTGWVAFPRTENGWEQRHPARGLDPLHLREVPVHLAQNAGLPVNAEAAELTFA